MEIQLDKFDGKGFVTSLTCRINMYSYPHNYLGLFPPTLWTFRCTIIERAIILTYLPIGKNKYFTMFHYDELFSSDIHYR